MPYQLKTILRKKIGDTATPVEMYLKFRDKYPGTFLLESSDHASRENSYSYICIDPMASFVVDKLNTDINYPDGKKEQFPTSEIDIQKVLDSFIQKFDAENLNLSFMSAGLFGYTAYDAIPLFGEIEFKNQSFDLPLLQYHLFRFQIVFSHYNNEIYLLEHLLEDQNSEIDAIQQIMNNRAVTHYQFTSQVGETTNFTDTDFLKIIRAGIDHCHLGNVFQVVFSRKFTKKFTGDEFNVYRALRVVNPSSYMFYFDYGDFRIFGSSPEAQLTINDHVAILNPIAGTFKRTGDRMLDQQLAAQLANDPKENAEHTMLVDLARNDLSKNSASVVVAKFKEVVYYSHVIHLVSKVTAALADHFSPMKIFADSFPAGTLSGAPKHKAMELIDQYEPESRGFYGGTIGMIGLDNSFNHAIFIRSFLSKNNELTFQAGCGIVAKSDPEAELHEVNNKLLALRKAIELANTL